MALGPVRLLFVFRFSSVWQNWAENEASGVGDVRKGAFSTPGFCSLIRLSSYLPRSSLSRETHRFSFDDSIRLRAVP
jgi:hypothetical protein